ncbi:hypothetical protein OAR97_05200 [Arcobacteraceae bacterium]|nr:hypothetical protein [Arcobacteraceae bacterium]
MTNAFKLYLQNGHYRVIDEKEFIQIAKNKLLNNDVLNKKYINRPINKLTAFQILQALKVKTVPVNALFIDREGQDEPILTTIENIEEDISTFIFEELEESDKNFSFYVKGSKESIIQILEKELKYKILDKERTLEDFIDKEIYFTTNLTYKKNHISVHLTPDKFISDVNTKKIYKYQSTILDPEGYQFNFKKNELFASREEAINQAKKLIDEHYNLPIRNSKIQKIIVKTDAHNTIIIFWPDIDTDNDYIMANDIIGTSDLAGDTKTSLLFFNECKEATPMQIKIAKNVIEKNMNIQTMSVRHL